MGIAKTFEVVVEYYYSDLDYGGQVRMMIDAETPLLAEEKGHREYRAQGHHNARVTKVSATPIEMESVEAQVKRALTNYVEGNFSVSIYMAKDEIDITVRRPEQLMAIMPETEQVLGMSEDAPVPMLSYKTRTIQGFRVDYIMDIGEHNPHFMAGLLFGELVRQPHLKMREGEMKI